MRGRERGGMYEGRGGGSSGEVREEATLLGNLIPGNGAATNGDATN